MPSVEELSRHYRDSYYQDPTGQYRTAYDPVELSYFDHRAAVALDFAASHGITAGKALDLGCGEGFFLKSAKARGFNVFGVDHSPVGLERQNPELTSANSENFDFGDIASHRYFDGLTFDLVYCKNVLEHVIDPMSIMERIASYMSPEAVAIIEVPNDFSRLHETIFGDTEKEQVPIFVPPVHLHYFTTKTLPELARSAGYSILDTYSDYPIDHLLLEDAFNYYKNKTLGRSAHSLRRKFFQYVSTLETSVRLSLFRSFYAAELGRDICVVFRR
jgi:2-polyprenyl-3-methyl-5-hydroxy-6-metoxy-1,4-benzoquinol methylase